MFWCNKTVVEFDLDQHQISFAGSSYVRFSFASPNIACPGKTNLMLDSVSSNKCLMFLRCFLFDYIFELKMVVKQRLIPRVCPA